MAAEELSPGERIARTAWLAVAVASCLAATGFSACSRAQSPEERNRLVATMPGEPRTLNRFVSARPAENLIALLTQDTLVRVNRGTGELEPRLARDWSIADDDRTYTLRLESEATFSDGQPFTAQDVVFTFQVLYNPRIASPMASSFEIDGQPLTARRIDDHTVEITFPAAYGPGLTILDSLPILPRHKLQQALDAGTFTEAWNVSTPVTEVAGLGPFVLAEYAPGQRLRFTRNPRFWRAPLPHLDEIELQIVPERNAELLRLQGGEVDVIFDFVPAEALSAMRRAEAAGAVRLMDAGVEISADSLWFNLTPGAPAAADRPWLQREELRHAISLAADRQAIVDTVHLGAAVSLYGPITPGHGEWYVPDLPRPPRDLAKARALLSSIGLRDRDGDDVLEDARGRDARFTLLTIKGNAIRERTSAMLQDHLRQVGLVVDIAAVEPGQLQTSWSHGEYEAIYYGVTYDSFDPARNLEYWMSSGSFHFWNAGQAKPATSWEGRIDDLIRRQSTSLDSAERRRLFREVQLIFAEHLPSIYFAAAKATVATSARLEGVVPSVLKPPVLWNAEALSVGANTRR